MSIHIPILVCRLLMVKRGQIHRILVSGVIRYEICHCNNIYTEYHILRIYRMKEKKNKNFSFKTIYIFWLYFEPPSVLKLTIHLVTEQWMLSYSSTHIRSYSTSMGSYSTQKSCYSTGWVVTEHCTG